MQPDGTPDVGLMVVVVIVYLLPSLLALMRRHRSLPAIVFVNTVLGWTVVGWFWAMIWSLTGNVRPSSRDASPG